MLLLLLACDPIQPGAGLPEGWIPPLDAGQLRLERDQVDFGSLSVLTDEPVTKTVMVTNAGTGELDVSGLAWLVGDTDAFSVDAPALITLEPGQSTPVQVTFAPPAHGSFEAALFPNGQRVLRFRGKATAPVARLLAETDDMGVVPVGCADETRLVIENAGSELLIVSDLMLQGTPGHTLTEGPTVLEPGDLAVLTLGLQPKTPGAAAARVVLSSNDPAGDRSVSVDALATSAGANSEDFVWLPDSQADVLFVVDSAAAGSGLLLEAQAHAEVLFDRLESGDVDWRVTAVDGEGCHATFDPWLSAKVYSPSQAGPALGLAFNGGVGETALLDLAEDALASTGQGGCLAGFRRSDAQLHIVLVGGRTDTSSTVLSDLEAYSDTLVVSAVMGDGTSGCQAAGGARTAAAESGGVVADLCAGDWDTVYAELAQLSWGNGDNDQRIELDETPAANTLEVVATGKVLHAWSWDGEALWLDGGAEELDLLDPISVSYELAQACY